MLEKLSLPRLVAAAIVAGVVTFAIHAIMVMLLGNAALYEATSQLWKPMGEHWFAGMVAINIVGALLFALAYAELHPCSAKGKREKATAHAKCGAMLGFVLWLAVGLPGMLVTYWTMAIPGAIIAEWVVGGFLGMVAAGAVVGAICKPAK